MTRVSFRFFVFALTCVSVLCGSASAAPSPREQRDWLLAYLHGDPGSPQRLALTREVLGQYRMTAAPAVLKLADAPYARFLLQNQISTIYPALYESEWNSLVNHPPLPILLDGFMELIVSNQLPPSLRSAGKQIGVRIAKRVLKGKSPFCKLDESDNINEPSSLQLAALKADVLNLISSCTYRIRIYNKAKKQLIEAREDPEIRETIRVQAAERFPVEFKKEFLRQMNELIADFPNLIVQKFGGEKHPIWSDKGGIVESVDGLIAANGVQEIQLGSFARGMRADLAAAAVLLESNSPADRGLAAGLFYAVVNRLIILTGGTAATWDPAKKELVLVPEAATADPKLAPEFKSEAFGGWGFEKGDDLTAFASKPWDWLAYAPADSAQPTPMRLLPKRFFVNSKGVARIAEPADLVQRSEDFAELILAVSEFLEATRPDGPFGKYFGPQEQFGDLLDPEKPMLFPNEGRLLALGIVAGIAQNLLHPKLGHVLETTTGIHLEFRDRSTFDGVETSEIETRGVARLLSAAGELRETLRGDEALLASEASLAEFVPQLQTLLQLGAVGLGAAAQEPEGRIRDHLNSQNPASSVQSHLDAMKTMLLAYNQTKLVPLQVRLANAWRVIMAEKTLGTLNLAESFELLDLWRESQAHLRANHPDLPWLEWDVRIYDFRSQLRTTLGL